MNEPGSATHGRKGASGFALIEALIALLVIAFGMLALASMQTFLSSSADVAKQRTEATRLAQEKMEELRGFTSVTGNVGSWDSLSDGFDTVSNYTVGAVTTPTNAQFTRTWTISGTPFDASRNLSVLVEWEDRSGSRQSVALVSLVSKSNPADGGFLTNPLPGNATRKQPKLRSVKIPFNSVDLGEGKSNYQLPGYTIVLNNVTGKVVERCTEPVNQATYSGATAGCLPFNALTLSGYVFGACEGGINGKCAVSSSDSGVAVLPTGIDTSQLTGWDSGGGKKIECFYRQAVDQNQKSTGYIKNFHQYFCLIPISTSNPSWSGSILLSGIPTTKDYKVCRIEHRADGSQSANMQNKQPYASVSESLANQNYYIDSSRNSSCTPIDEIAVASGAASSPDTSVGAFQTVVHQDCHSEIGPPSNTPNQTTPVPPGAVVSLPTDRCPRG